MDEGSYGGRPGRDGLDSTDCLIANTRNHPIEELEWRFPMLTERYELRDDGHGLVGSRRSSSGLREMQARVIELGGALEIASANISER